MTILLVLTVWIALNLLVVATRLLSVEIHRRSQRHLLETQPPCPVISLDAYRHDRRHHLGGAA